MKPRSPAATAPFTCNAAAGAMKSAGRFRGLVRGPGQPFCSEIAVVRAPRHLARCRTDFFKEIEQAANQTIPAKPPFHCVPRHLRHLARFRTDFFKEIAQAANQTTPAKPSVRCSPRRPRHLARCRSDFFKEIAQAGNENTPAKPALRCVPRHTRHLARCRSDFFKEIVRTPKNRCAPSHTVRPGCPSFTSRF